jgi:hypothetical protein
MLLRVWHDSSLSKSRERPGSGFMTYMHLGTELLGDCFSFMQTPEQYRAFAEECERLAKQTEDEHYRKVLGEMAKEWIKLAEEADGED